MIYLLKYKYITKIPVENYLIKIKVFKLKNKI
jgi:hypothetical protein